MASKKPKPNYQVVKADIEHLDRLMRLSQEFFDESNFAGIMTYAPQRWRENLIAAWESDAFMTLIVNDPTDGRTVGYAHIVREAAYTVEALGEIYQWFIEKDARGRGAARALRDAVNLQFDRWDCRLRYVECSAGLDAGKNDKQFFNLWAKIGYEFLGTALIQRVKINGDKVIDSGSPATGE